MENHTNNTKWFSLASVWFGGIVSVPALLIGSLLISSLSFSSAVFAGFIGFGIVVLLMSIISMYAVEQQKSSVSLASNSFGSQGAQIIVGLVIGLSTLGWFGIQSNIAGASFSKIILETTQCNLPVWLSSSFWGLVMLLTAVFGFKILKWLNYIAVPAIIILIIYGLFIVFKNHDFQEVLDFKPENTMSILQAIGLSIGFISVGVVISPDYNRFAASKKDAILGSLFGILPSALILLSVGAMFAITQGTYDIVEIFASLGFPFLAMSILILATWTSNVMNMYSSGLAFNGLLNFKASARSKTTLIVGVIGIVLAAIGLLENFMGFINILTTTVAPIAGVLVADYFFSRTKNEEKYPTFNWVGMLSWCCGATVMILMQAPIKYIIGIAAAGLFYYIISKMLKK